MKNSVRFPRALAALLLLVNLGLPPSGGIPAHAGTPQQTPGFAGEILSARQAPGGIAAIVGAPDPSLALALAREGSLTVHCLFSDKALCEKARDAIRAQNAYGPVSADILADGQLPYAENLVNILIIDPYADLAQAGLTVEEAIRVLAPLGYGYLSVDSKPGDTARADAIAGKLHKLGMDLGAPTINGRYIIFQKPWPQEIDEWGHYLHGADGNPVAHDTVVGPPKHLQWVSDPLYMKSHETDSTVRTIVTARGRIFDIEDQSPNSLEGDTLPDKWFLVARDAFNGARLWQVPVPQWGWREWKSSWFLPRPGDIPLNIEKRLVAAGDKVYVTLGYRAPVSQLDARTGKIIQTYAGTERTGEILYLDGKLILSTLEGDLLRVMAVDAASGKRLWVTKNAYAGSAVDYYKGFPLTTGAPDAKKIDPALNIAADARTVAFVDGPDVVALDAATGAEQWRSRFPMDDADLKAGGILSIGNLWIGALIVSDGVVVNATPSVLAGLDAATGRVLWQQPKKYLGHLWYEWKDVFVIDGLVWTWSAELGRTTLERGGAKGPQAEQWPLTANGYDLKTGALRKQVPTGSALAANHHHRCYRDKATTLFILASRRGSEYINLAGGPHTIDNWARGTCHVGMMPANGLQYCPPHACQCYIEEKLTGMNALAPEVPSRWARKIVPAAEPLLERGPAYGQAAGPLAGAEDWPAFRGDPERDGHADTPVAASPKPLWSVKAGGKITPPTIAAGGLYAARTDEHAIICLDAGTGARRWLFTAGGRIDSPPTYEAGALVFGCADGWVYCLRAADGQLAWRFRAAPADRLVGACGQLESAWPVPGSVLVKNGVAYFVAGRSSHLDGGLYLYGVEVATGRLLHRAKEEGPAFTTENLEINNLPPQGVLPDVMRSEGDAIYLRSAAYTDRLEKQEENPLLKAQAGFLDGTFFKRSPWMFNGSYANMVSYDAQAAYCLRMFDSLQGLTPDVFFKPGDKGYQLFALPRQAGKRNPRRPAQNADPQRWSQRLLVRGNAMALARGCLFVAGPPDVVDPQDPLGAFEGRKGGVLCAFDPATGNKLDEQKLDSPPVFNGLAVAHGKLHIVFQDGTIACYGRP